MSHSINWDNVRKQRLVYASKGEHTESEETFQACAEAQHHKDIQFLRWFLTQELNETHRRRIECNLEWLLASPVRTLGPSYSSYRSFYARLFRAIQGGHYDPAWEPDANHPRSEASKRSTKRRQLRWKRYEEFINSRPDWMADSNLLPKKPPGK